MRARTRCQFAPDPRRGRRASACPSRLPHIAPQCVAGNRRETVWRFADEGRRDQATRGHCCYKPPRLQARAPAHGQASVRLAPLVNRIRVRPRLLPVLPKPTLQPPYLTVRSVNPTICHTKVRRGSDANPTPIRHPESLETRALTHDSHAWACAGFRPG